MEEKKNKINHVIKNKVTCKSFYDKSDSQEKSRPFSLSEAYESKSETKSVHSCQSLSENEDMMVKIEKKEELEGEVDVDDIFPK